MSRVFNFSAGPAVIPEPVLQQAKADMLNWQGTGASILEISHRSKAFVELAANITEKFKKVLQVPDNYKVLFLHGGARHQFAMVPQNLMRDKAKSAQIITGHWSKMAAKEATLFGTVNVAADGEALSYLSIPKEGAWQIDPDAAYLHYCDNETISGLEFPFIPDSKGLPLVADMSSNILSRHFDVSKFGLIYACAQKNLGPSGISVVIIREDLLGHALPNTPMMYDYQKNAAKDCMLNTPPCFGWYMIGLMLDWVETQGGLTVVEARNAKKAQWLYDFIDGNDFYENKVDRDYRSRMNVTFSLQDESLNDAFLMNAEKEGLTALKGHRSLGGMRASIYNAMPEEGVRSLITFMKDFADHA